MKQLQDKILENNYKKCMINIYLLCRTLDEYKEVFENQSAKH